MAENRKQGDGLAENLNKSIAIPLYLPIDEKRARFVPNAYHLPYAQAKGLVTILQGRTNRQWYIITPQSIEDKDKVEHQVRVVGKGNTQHVEIPEKTLTATGPCNSCGAAIEPIFNSHKSKFIKCGHCGVANPASWFRDVTETEVQLINPFRQFDDPIESSSREIAKRFRPFLQMPFSLSRHEQQILKLGENRRLNLHTFNNFSREQLEELVAVTVGRLRADGPSVAIILDDEALYGRRYVPRGKKMMSAEQVFQMKADLEAHRASEAELVITDQLNTLYTVLNDRTGQYNPINSNKSYFDELLDIHKRLTSRRGERYHMVSSISIFDPYGVDIKSVFDWLNPRMHQENFLHLYDYQTPSYHTASYLVSPRRHNSFDERRRVAKYLAQLKVRDLDLPASLNDAARMQKLMDSLTKAYEKALADGFIGGWNDFEGF